MATTAPGATGTTGGVYDPAAEQAQAEAQLEANKKFNDWKTDYEFRSKVENSSHASMNGAIQGMP